MDLVYVAGGPGAGKSTLIAALTGCLPATEVPAPVPHQLLDPGPPAGPVVLLGRPHPSFPGTDRLSMSIQPKVAAWLADRPAALVLGEGDRLATGRFLASAAAAGYTVTLLWLDCPPRLAADRRSARAGSTPADAWVRSRFTKAARLAAAVDADPAAAMVRLDSTRSPGALAAAARAAVPALTVLPGCPDPAP